MKALDVLGIVDEVVGEAILEAPPIDGLEEDAVSGGRGDTLGKGSDSTQWKSVAVFFYSGSIAVSMEVGGGEVHRCYLLGSSPCIYLPRVLHFNDFLFT